MIEVSVRELIENTTIMREIMQKSLKSRPAFLLARIIREIDKEYESFNSARAQLVEKYGLKDEAGQLIMDDDNGYKLRPGTTQDFNREIYDLLNTTVQLNVDYIDLNDLSEVEFTPQQMLALEPFIKD